ncbi:ribbon-helix-helix domain-containing protein [Aquimarina aggregata]|uniref:ribbon-helix-helix domain-containing protein n=1 Tax=Aquimarina aggregata TaxID=1642818 RepID=UPI002493A090|nr:type II toxin-antitoxin system ParD family antitoxin [Aquimarina aggregata]
MVRPETHKYVPLNLSLTPEFAAFIQEKMDSGFYTSQAEVVRDALRKMELCDRLIYDLQISILKDMLKPSLKDAALGKYQDYSLEELIKLKPRAPLKSKPKKK